MHKHASSQMVLHHGMFLVWHVGNDALFLRPSVAAEPAELALAGLFLTAGRLYEHVSIQVLQ